jgi:beta-lactamase superfamily II metal-dependent hydrolase
VGIEVEFLTVGDGNGDAIIVRYTDANSFWLHVVDAGRNETGEKMVQHIETLYGPGVQIAQVVLSHADDDHATGLIPVLTRFNVHTLWMNKPWDYANEVIDHFHGNFSVQGWIDETKRKHPYLVELQKIADNNGVIVRAPLQGERIGPFVVLAPSRQRYVSLIPDLEKTPPPYREDAALPTLANLLTGGVRKVAQHVMETMNIETLDDNPPDTSASNETSVVQLGLRDNSKILLTADVGPQGLLEAAQYAHTNGILSPPNLVQIPHHGSRRNVTPSILDIWLGPRNSGAQRRGFAFVSLGKNKNDYPRRKVKNAFMRRGYPVYTNRNAAIVQTFGMPRRAGLIDSVPEPFSPDVEDDA